MKVQNQNPNRRIWCDKGSKQFKSKENGPFQKKGYGKNWLNTWQLINQILA